MRHGLRQPRHGDWFLFAGLVSLGVWAGDIACILLGDGSEVFLATLMDVYTRSMRGWELLRDLTHRLSVGALMKALKKGRPEIHHTEH